MEFVLHGLLWLAVCFRVATLLAVGANQWIRQWRSGAAETFDRLLILPLALSFALDVIGGLAGAVLAAVVADPVDKLLAGVFGGALLLFFAVFVVWQIRPTR